LITYFAGSRHCESCSKLTITGLFLESEPWDSCWPLQSRHRLRKHGVGRINTIKESERHSPRLERRNGIHQDLRAAWPSIQTWQTKTPDWSRAIHHSPRRDAVRQTRVQTLKPAHSQPGDRVVKLRQQTREGDHLQFRPRPKATVRRPTLYYHDVVLRLGNRQYHKPTSPQ